MSLKENFIRVLTENSVNKEYELARLEWDITGAFSRGNKCICNHDIVENIKIRNRYNFIELIIGNCCQHKILNITTSKKHYFDDLKRIVQDIDVLVGKKTTEFAYYLKIINERDRDYLMNLHSKEYRYNWSGKKAPEYVLTQKQTGWLRSINTKIYNASYRVNSIKSDNDDLLLTGENWLDNIRQNNVV